VDRTLLAGKISLRKTVFKIIRKKQIESIKKARYCFNAELGLTAETFKEIGKKFLPLPIPIVYNREKLDEFRPTDRINGFVQAMRKSRCSIFSHASQMWVRKESFSEFEWTRASKNNQWLIEGFANFTKMAKGSDGLLVLVDYGQDVSAAKALCLELDILDKVLWLPKLSRIEVMYLLSICDIGVGEFLVSPGSIWGGTGWEVLASGKPLLQTFNFSNEEFFNAFGHEPPPILDVKSSEDVSKHLFDWYREPEKYIKQGVESRNWFNANNGIGLAKEWLRLLALIWD
jgi:hypothetical protein